MELFLTLVLAISVFSNIALIALLLDRKQPDYNYIQTLELRLLDLENENKKLNIENNYRKNVIKKTLHYSLINNIENDIKALTPPPPPAPPPGRELGKPIKPYSEKITNTGIYIKCNDKKDCEYKCKSMRELIYEIDWHNLKIHDTKGGECSPVVENMIGELFKVMERYAQQEVAQTLKQVINRKLSLLDALNESQRVIALMDERIRETVK